MKHNTVSMTIGQAAQALEVLLLSKSLAPFLHGSPGIGKSAICAQLARKYNWKLIDVRLSDREPTDLAGLPAYNEDRTRATYMPFDEFPLATDPLPINPETGLQYSGWLVLLDEFKNAAPATQSAAYKFVLDRKVGTHDLHPECYVMAAGNLDTDGALAQPMSTALISRFAHLYVQQDLNEWISEVGSKLHNSDIVAFLNFRKDSFYTFDPKLTTPYAAPRTWKELDKVLEQFKQVSSQKTKTVKYATLSGIIGSGVAADYLSFVELKKDIITFDQILRDPQNAPVPDMGKSLGLVWATIFMVVDNMTLANLHECGTYINRFPHEFIAAAARTALIRHNEWLDSNPAGVAFQQRMFDVLFPA